MHLHNTCSNIHMRSSFCYTMHTHPFNVFVVAAAAAAVAVSDIKKDDNNMMMVIMMTVLMIM